MTSTINLHFFHSFFKIIVLKERNFIQVINLMNSSFLDKYSMWYLQLKYNSYWTVFRSCFLLWFMTFIEEIDSFKRDEMLEFFLSCLEMISNQNSSTFISIFCANVSIDAYYFSFFFFVSFMLSHHILSLSFVSTPLWKLTKPILCTHTMSFVLSFLVFSVVATVYSTPVIDIDIKGSCNADMDNYPRCAAV